MSSLQKLFYDTAYIGWVTYACFINLLNSLKHVHVHVFYEYLLRS